MEPGGRPNCSQRLPVDYVGDVAAIAVGVDGNAADGSVGFEQYCEALFAQERFGSRPQAERRSRFGDGTGEPVAIRFRSHADERGIILDPEMKFGEAYMDAALSIEEGSIADVLAVILRQQPRRQAAALCPTAMVHSLSLPSASAIQFRARGRDAMSRIHYDLDGQLYCLFLDADRQYSCVLF